MSENKDNEKNLPTIDFSTFILSLASTVQFHLGLIPNPTTNKTEKNLVLAKQTIDILGILKDKTEGNCSEDETNIFENLLSSLRMAYVECSKK
ncbi:DUF1844 domain-containing protein [bacterium]|nr:DUF1844 domain-containing protein [bacterium]